ncbi:MAG: hypothetical protein FH756_05850 [Firmicutes bacterium]|nr:hypothetical protein [Bacillota bacterium]
MEFIESFSPKGKAFSFHFTKDTCYQVRTGKCPLEINNQDEYCAKLSTKIYDTFEMDPVFIVRHRCGHYDFSNGQHRTCIAGRLGLTIPVWIGEERSLCDSCRNIKGSIIKEF